MYLEQRVNERRSGTSAQKYEGPHEQDGQHYGQEPPLLIVFQEIPELGKESYLFLLGKSLKFCSLGLTFVGH